MGVLGRTGKLRLSFSLGQGQRVEDEIVRTKRTQTAAEVS